MNGLKFIRTRCNISLSELAEALGVSRQQVSAWENGVKPIAKKDKNNYQYILGLIQSILVKLQKLIKNFFYQKDCIEDKIALRKCILLQSKEK